MLVTLTQSSGNRKTGPIPVSTTERESCPTSCAWYNKGCYALYGPLGMHWRKVQSRGMVWAKFVKAVKDLPKGILWRHNQAGDLPGKKNKIDSKALAQLVQANVGKRGFTYTHKPVLDNEANASAVKAANDKGFTVNLSADNIGQADSLYALGIAPVTVVLPSDAPRKLYTPAGNTVIACPAEYMDDMNCARCQLCAIPKRKAIIGFLAHGTASKTVSQRASLPIVEQA